MSPHPVPTDTSAPPAPALWSVAEWGELQRDPLTQLPGRAVAHQWLDAALQQQRPQRTVGAILLGLDRFKLISTTLGRQAGDVVLMQVARRLESVIQACLVSQAYRAFAARVGGDQFLVAVQDLVDPARLLVLAEALSEEMSRPFTVEGHEVCARASIGVVADGVAYHQADQMLRDAETAMQRANALHAGGVVPSCGTDTGGCSKVGLVVFAPQMHEEACRRMQLEMALRHAIAHEQLSLVYQPIISFSTGQVAYCEVLTRWTDPQLGSISPAEFIPIAEESGLILPLGEWVLRQSCQQLSRWRRDGFVDNSVGMSVNLSRIQMQQPDLVAMVQSALSDAQLCAGGGDVHLEITESAIMTDPDRAISVLKGLREQGVSISMDDFGTQYSSLACLHQFPLNTLKIDRAFVRNLEQRREYAAVVQAIIMLAHNLDMQVIAEGIETSEQAVQLLTMECDHAQGYHFARPMTPEQAALFMATYRPPVLIDAPSLQVA